MRFDHAFSVLSGHAKMVTKNFIKLPSCSTSINFVFASMKLLTDFENDTKTLQRVNFLLDYVLQHQPLIGRNLNVSKF